MTRTALPLALLAAAALTLSACGSDPSDGPSAAGAGDGTAFKTGGASTSFSGPKLDLASLDVCSLLTSTDAIGVARAQKLSNDPSVTYTVKAIKPAASETNGNPSCKFQFGSGGDTQGTVQFTAESAASFTVFSTAKRIKGLGDEAYSENGGVPVVRVGNVMFSTGENSFDTVFATALMRKLIANVE